MASSTAVVGKPATAFERNLQACSSAWLSAVLPTLHPAPPCLQTCAALARLEQEHAANFDLVVLRQMLWDALFTAGRHRDALVVAAQVFAAVQDRFGGDSAELQLVAVRLGISSAACGRLQVGLKLIYDAAPVLQHNLGRMVEQAQAAAQGGLDEQAAVSVSWVLRRRREGPKRKLRRLAQQRWAAPLAAA